MKKVIEEEITIQEFCERFLLLNDLETPDIIDISDKNIEIETLDKTGNLCFKRINKVIIKPKSNYHYTDGNLKGTDKHAVVENNQKIYLDQHPDFKLINEPINVIDLEVDDLHTYLANGRLNHNTTAGGQALGFHASVRIKTKTLGKVKVGEDIVGVQTECIIKKNRVGPPFREASFNIYFNSGIDDSGHWFEKLVGFELINKVNNRTYTYTIPETGELLEFSEKEFRELLNTNRVLRDSAYKQLCEHCIMKYRHEEADSESIKIVENKEDND